MTTIDDLKKDNIFTESNNIRLRKLTGEDRSDFFRVLKAISSMPALYELDRVNELIWKEILSSDTVVAFAVEKKEQAVYVGNCMVKHPEAGILELGIDIAPEYQNQGIATEAMRLLVGKIRLLCPDQRLISRMYSDNDRSRHIILGLGGVKIAEEPAEYKEAAALAAAISTAGGEKPAGTDAGENPAEPDDEDIICATTGGINVSCAPSFSDMGEDVDNCPVNMMELKHLDSWACTMSFTALGTSPEAIRLALGAADKTVATGKATTIIPRMKVEDEDFQDIWWVGEIAGGGLAAIKLIDAFSTGGFNLQTGKASKGQLSVELTGFVSIEDTDTVPMEFYVGEGVA